MVASLLAIDLKACYKAGSGYRVVADIEGMDSDSKLTAILANRLVVGNHRSLRVLNWCSAGIPVSGESGIGVPGVLTIMIPEAMLD